MGFRQWVNKIISLVGQAILWLWAGAKAVLDWIGWTAAHDDAEQAKSMIDKGLEWLFLTPWWVPAMLATGFTLFLVRLASKREVSGTQRVRKQPQLQEGTKLKEFTRKVFRNETVQLDDCRYINCTFENCVLMWGGGSTRIDGIIINGDFKIATTSPLVAAAWDMLTDFHKANKGKTHVETRF